MKNILLTLAVVLVFGLMSIAQDTTPGSPQSGAQGTSPTTGTSSTSSATGSGQYGGTSSGTQSSPSSPSASGSMGQSSSSSAESSTKGEKKLKGCIESQGGQYMLREKNGNQVQLTGSADLASHVGHQVTVHGTYESNSASASGSSNDSKMPSASGSPTANPSASSSSSGQQFMVNKIDHEASTCKVKGANVDANPGAGMSGTSSSGTQAPDHQ